MSSTEMSYANPATAFRQKNGAETGGCSGAGKTAETLTTSACVTFVVFDTLRAAASAAALVAAASASAAAKAWTSTSA